MTRDMNELVHEIFQVLDEHLQRRNALDGAVALLASGAAFEQWLAFEARIAIELARERLGLSSEVEISNEYRKIDLYVADLPEGDLGIEFKLVHNNKNWKHKTKEVRKDVYSKKGGADVVARAAFVGVVRKLYDAEWARDYYPGQNDDEDWESVMWARLEGAHKRRVRRTGAAGHRFDLDPAKLPYAKLLPGDHGQYYFQLRLCLPVASDG